MMLRSVFGANAFNHSMKAHADFWMILSIVLITFVLLLFGYRHNTFNEYLPVSLGHKNNLPEAPILKSPKIFYNVSGPVKKIGDSYIILEANIPQITRGIIVNQKIELRKVFITPATKIIQLTFVSADGKNKSPKESPISLHDLKIDDYVEAIGNKDISASQEFEATQIRALPKTP